MCFEENKNFPMKGLQKIKKKPLAVEDRTEIKTFIKQKQNV